MTTLITGGASKVGSKVAALLKEAGQPVMFGSHSGRVPAGFESVKLDWDEPSTFPNPFVVAKARGTRIKNVYLMAPLPDIHHAPKIIPFIELAVQSGVARFVYLSATIADREHDSGGLGEIPGYLEDMGLDYVVLRPTWFIDNLETDYRDDIAGNGVITTAVPSGKVPFVWSGDIAKVAFDAFVSEGVPFETRDPLILGPDLLSWNEVAGILSEVLGRRIEHRVVSVEEMTRYYMDLYGPGQEDVARWLVDLDVGIEAGSQEGLERTPGAVIGKLSLEAWVKKNKHLFV
ncbi:ergot alkaloid A [Coprinopsis marcescibilis]|uniref:Ergot alkaloid A n=1 Tax=Coprinopsis marcescibilis TaxID=230819 RepID=A0A5C3KV31_COPMA|nr:ergot alkaloid A [Coprinopsis marcescibilis]